MSNRIILIYCFQDLKRSGERVLRCVCLCRCAVFRMEETHLDTRLINYLRRFGPVLVASAALYSDGFRFRCPLTMHLGAGSLVQGWLSSCPEVHVLMFVQLDLHRFSAS